jgi:hypothetical protein
MMEDDPSHYLVEEERIRLAAGAMLNMLRKNPDSWTRSELHDATLEVAPFGNRAVEEAARRFIEAGTFKILPPDQVVFDEGVT